MLPLGDRESLYDWLIQRGLGDWVPTLRSVSQQAVAPGAHGRMPDWQKAWQDLPLPDLTAWDASGSAVTVNRIVCQIKIQRFVMH